MPDVQDYGTILKTMVTGGEVVCGFSLGALILAHNLGALTAARAVVLLASNPFPDPPENRINREAVRDRILAGDARGWVSEYWSTMSASSRENLKDFVASMAEESAHLITSQTELAASRPGAADDLLTTDLPLIFVTGGRDRQTPWAPIESIIENAKAAHLSVLEELGHFALIEAPERVAEAIREGLQTVGPNLNNERQRDETRKHTGVTS